MSRNTSKMNRNATGNWSVAIETLETRCLMSATVAGHLPYAATRHAAAPPAVVLPASHAQHRNVHQASAYHHGMAFKGLQYNHNQTLLRADR